MHIRLCTCLLSSPFVCCLVFFLVFPPVCSKDYYFDSYSHFSIHEVRLHIHIFLLFFFHCFLFFLFFLLLRLFLFFCRLTFFAFCVVFRKC